MAHNRIYLCLAHMSGEEQKFIKEAFDTNWVVPLGPNVNGFEDDLKQFVDENKEPPSIWLCWLVVSAPVTKLLSSLSPSAHHHTP